MFGIIQSGCGLNSEQRQEWLGHVCGLCLSLRDNYGQLARLATNYDAALLSVLCEAQRVKPLPRVSHLCPIRGRGFQRAEVVAAAPGAQYAAALAIMMTAAKIEDHRDDGDGWWRYLPRFLTGWFDRRRSTAHRLAEGLGFQPAYILAQTTHQPRLEQQTNLDFFSYARPTELAVGAAFRHTAVITACPANAEPLEQIGQLFGRIMYLLDNYRDYDADRVHGKFNALARCFAPEAIQAQAWHIFSQTHHHLKQEFDRLHLPRPRLARQLLVEQLGRTARRTLAGTTGSGVCPGPGELLAGLEEPPPPGERRRSRRSRRDAGGSIHGGDSWCLDWYYCCDCCSRQDHNAGCCCDCSGGDSEGCCSCGLCQGDSNCCCGCDGCCCDCNSN